MKTCFFPEGMNPYKANLHCHTTFSDGKLTPDEIKKAYTDKGYSVVAFSDHEVCFSHNELADGNFLPITSYEAAFNEDRGKSWIGAKCYHINLYAKDKDNAAVIMPDIDAIKYQNGNAGRDENYMPKYYGEPCKHIYSKELINRFVAEAKRQGFLVSLNHPAWSLQNFCDYEGLSGFCMFELSNYGCVAAGYIEDCAHIYDRMLRSGITGMNPTCTDDNHNHYPFDSPNSDSFGGFTVVYADKLEYSSVMRALENGNFYASTGPTFESAYFEDGKVYIKCSPVRSIRLLNEGRDAPVAIAKDGELITEAVFDVEPSFVGRYIRVDIRDENGKFAATKPLFTKDLY